MKQKQNRAKSFTRALSWMELIEHLLWAIHPAMKITTPFCMLLRQWQQKRHPDPNAALTEKKTKQDVWLSNTAWLLKHNDKCRSLGDNVRYGNHWSDWSLLASAFFYCPGSTLTAYTPIKPLGKTNLKVTNTPTPPNVNKRCQPSTAQRRQALMNRCISAWEVLHLCWKAASCGITPCLPSCFCNDS